MHYGNAPWINQTDFTETIYRKQCSEIIVLGSVEKNVLKAIIDPRNITLKYHFLLKWSYSVLLFYDQNLFVTFAGLQTEG